MLRHNRPNDLRAPACVALLVEAARTLGLAPVARPRPTLADLQRTVRAHPEAAELEPALAFVRTQALMTNATPIAPLFTPQLAGLMPSLLARRESEVAPESMAKLFRLATDMERSADLPPYFAGALRAVMDQNGWTSARLAKIAGVDEATVRQWCRGSEPRSHQHAICKALETALSVPPGTLLDRMSTTAIRMNSCSVLTDDVRDELDAHSIPIRALGDDWNGLDDHEKRWRVATLKKLTLTGVPYRDYARSDHHDELPPFCNPDFDREFEALRIFKEAKETDLFDDDPFEIMTVAGKSHFKNGGIWRETTSVLQHKNAIRILRALRAELPPTLQAQLDRQGLGALASAKLVVAGAKAIARRRCRRLARSGFFADSRNPAPKDGLVFAHGDVSRLIVIAGYLNPATGYLFKNPPVLRCLDGFIDQAWIDGARADWPAVAVAERKLMTKAAGKIARRIYAVRDPWLPIMPLLELPAPLEPIYRALDRMEADRPPFAASPVGMARHDRDHCLLRLWVHTKLRRSCLVQLTYRPDNTGMLRFTADGGALLVIPQELFKNAGSSALPEGGQPIEFVIEPAERRLLRILRRWVVGEGHSRSLLCHDHNNHFLFPGDKGGALNDASVHRICMAFSTLYLVALPWRPGGIPGVLPFGAHAMRDLAGTHVIKVSGLKDDAALALLDTVETITKAYSRFTSADKTRRSTRQIRASLPPDLFADDDDVD
ncbi:helix-turn-helix transcriptional regulator [Bosea sp. AAP35]|uniref:helix-turn-helix domain-containing protein n=1 Tax=Bosea sp. AAP35 TaxID=1523417 RepID=UPI0012E251BB|nr:helix-turn-helix transcriptional regulator [Bosea sp. AAP35]